MRQDEDRALDAFRSQLFLVYLGKYGLAALTVWAFLYGCAVLALRGALGLQRDDLAWGLASLPVALAPAVWLAVRRLPSPAAVRAVLDRHARAGGLLMAGAECPIGGWQDELPELNLPAVRWRSQRSWGLFAAG